MKHRCELVCTTSEQIQKSGIMAHKGTLIDATFAKSFKTKDKTAKKTLTQGGRRKEESGITATRIM